MSTDFVISDWVSQAEAAKLRGVSRQAIAKLVQANRVRSVEVAGRTLVNRADVENYVPLKAGRPRKAASP